MIKAVFGIVTIVIIACLGLPMLLMSAVMGGGSAACSVTAPSTDASKRPADAGQWDTDQVNIAVTIIEVGGTKGVGRWGQTIALAVAMQESRLRNLPYLGADNDHDSIGVFQQRPSQGWGTPEQLADPAYQAGKFYDKLKTIPGWQTMSLSEAAQAVQVSAYPDAYAKWTGGAIALVDHVVSSDPRAIAVDREQCVSICPSLVASPDGSGGSCVEASAVFDRAQSWLTAWQGGPVPYLSSNVPGDLFGGYRRDCSGYVSMALSLRGPGLSTVELAQRSTMIRKADLRPGDLMINPDTDLRGHVVLFAGWSKASMSSYYGYEQSGDGGTHYREIPYPYFGSYSMTPYRWGKP